MNRIAQFYKVSFEQFRDAMKNLYPDDNENMVRKMYESIKLPMRATSGSAGYDFFTPFSFSMVSGSTVVVPTGIRVKMEDGWVLKLYPRSGLGFKYRLQLDNTVGIIDSDYFGADNEGHIMIKMTCDAKERKSLAIEMGTGFAQGIFLPYGITKDDDARENRRGGFGSTTK